MQIAEQIPVMSWLKTLPTQLKARLKAISDPLESADYDAWRQQFLINRLRLSGRLMFYCFLSLTGFLIVAIPAHSSNLYWFTRDLLVLLSLSTCIVLQQTAVGRNHPEALFLGLCWTMSWFTQLSGSLTDHAEPNVSIWTLVFLAMAAAVPVHWTLHLTAQVGVVASYFCINAILGQSFDAPLHEQITTWLCLFWACFICNLAVYLYERLRRAEFQARRQLQTFVQTVSHELRTPALSSLNQLKYLLSQATNQVAIARPVLEAMQESSDRQLALIESLLERARCTANQIERSNPHLPRQSRLAQWLKAGLEALETLKARFELRFGANPSTLEPKLLPPSTDYEAWRDRLVMNRLNLVWWIAILADISLSLPVVQDVITNPISELELLPYGVLLLSMLLWYSFYKSPWGQAQPVLSFLSFAASITVVSQFTDALLGEREPSIFVWTLVFLMLATLIPVQWGLHVLAQALTVLTYLLVVAIWGPAPEMSLVDGASVIWYVGWVFLICDLAVYTYERLQQAEFESRRQLQIFLHSVAHDLRTPVLGTGMVLGTLLNKPLDTIVLSRSALERMVQGGDRQLRLINFLLDAHTSIDQGVTCNCEPIQLKALVQAIATDMEPLVAQSRMTLIDQVPADLPLVRADAIQLWRVFENLIANVLKYNPPGIELILGATTSRQSVRCTVQDNGVGIHPSLQAQIFDLYSRGSRVKRSPGLGLGLYLCRQIITAHGGEIGVISQPGQGSIFWFTLPLL